MQLSDCHSTKPNKNNKIKISNTVRQNFQIEMKIYKKCKNNFYLTESLLHNEACEQANEQDNEQASAQANERENQQASAQTNQ